MAQTPYPSPPAIIRVPAPAETSVVRVPVPTEPAVLRSIVEGPIGPKSTVPGPPGLPGDYGYIRFGETIGTAPNMLSAHTDLPFIVQPPQVIRNALKPPFSDFSFVDDDGLLRARKSGDAMLLSIRLSVVPQVYGGWFRVSVAIPGNVSGLAGPVASRTVPLTDAAGATHRLDEDIDVFPADSFVANGAMIALRASVPVSLSDEVLFIRPTVAAP